MTVTTPEIVALSDVTELVETFGAGQYQLGATSRDGQVLDLQNQLTLSEENRAEVQKAFDDYRAANPDTAATLFGFWAGSDTNPAPKGQTARQSFDRDRAYLGDPGVYRMFYEPNKLPANFVGSNADFGPPVVVSFKHPPLEVVAGKWDALYVSWFASIPADRRVWWSYWHEPEDDIEKGAFTAAQYRAAWEHIIALAPRRKTLRATLILMGFSLFKTSRVISDYVARGLDVLAWDSYLTGTTKTVANCIAKPKAVSDSFGLGFGIAEASGSDAGKISTYAAALPAGARAAEAEFITWFETNKSDGDWRMREIPGAVDGWVAATRVAA